MFFLLKLGKGGHDDSSISRTWRNSFDECIPAAFSENKSLEKDSSDGCIPRRNSRDKARYSSAYEKKAKAFRRALNRVATWELPGKEYVVEYLRHVSA